MYRAKTLSSRRGRRGGSVLVCTIVCLAVVMALLGSLLKSTLLTRQRVRQEQQLRQAEWLIEAGLERARFRLAGEERYSGETWRLPAGRLETGQPGDVSIEVLPAADRDDRGPDERGFTRVRISAAYPAEGPYSIRRSRTFRISDAMVDDVEGRTLSAP
jgi:hypothetical protein